MELLAQYDSDVWAAIGALGTWAGAVTTLVAVIWAIYGPEFIAKWRTPIASIVCGNDGHLFQRMKTHGLELDIDYYVRLAVYNEGKESAFDVECMVVGLSEWTGQTWVVKPDFAPIRLRWTLTDDPCLSHLTPGSYRLLNLGRLIGYSVTDPFQSSFNLSFEETNQSIGPVLPCGTFQLELTVSSRNHLLYRGCIEFEWPLVAEDEILPIFSPDRFKINLSKINIGRVHSG